MKLIRFNGEKDYKKLSHLPFNRDYSLRHDLVESIKTYGFINAINLCYTDCITGIRELFILDGQNRALAANYLNYTFYGDLIDEEPKTMHRVVELVAKYNNSSKAWTFQNYCKAYIALNKVDYITLLRLSKNNGLSIQFTAGLLQGYYSHNQKSSSKVKDGSFKITSQTETVVTFGLIKEFKFKPNVKLIGAFHKLRLNNHKYNHDKFYKKLHENHEEINAINNDKYYQLFVSWFK